MSRAAALVRRWVALYTAGLPADIRDARRDEIEADLWSQAYDDDGIASPEASPGDVLGRLVFGMGADVAWRLEHRGSRVRPVPIRSLPMGTRVVAASAIIGGAALTATALVWIVLKAVSPAGPLWAVDATPLQLMFLTIVGNGALILLSVSTWGLVIHFNERVKNWVALAGSAAGLAGVLAAMGGWLAGLVLPVGSAIVAWDLARFGALPRSIAIAHAAAAVAFIIPLVMMATDPGTETAVILLAIPYPLSWIAIGISILRGQPATDRLVTSSE